MHQWCKPLNVGYHPGQKKVAVIELDKRDTDFKTTCPLSHCLPMAGKLGKQQAAKDWGDFQRYHYLQFDFTEATEEGLYQVMYGDAASPVFPHCQRCLGQGYLAGRGGILLAGTDVPHACERKYRVWHDFCHHDDARMAKTDINHIDGIYSGNLYSL